MSDKCNYSEFARIAAMRLQEHIDAHPMAYRTTDDLWKALPGESRSSIEKAFKHVANYRLKEYLVKVRLEHSKQFLRDGMPIKRVAIKCFYKSQSAYCTAFRRYYRQSPTDWIKDKQFDDVSFPENVKQ